jgi:serine protease
MKHHSLIRRLAAAPAIAAVMLLIGAAAASAADYVPGEVVVGYTTASVPRAVGPRLGIRSVASAPAPGVQVLRLTTGTSVPTAISRLRSQPGVAYAVPNYVAHTAGNWIPDDRGRTSSAGGWQALQWNFLAGTGVNAPAAWANLLADGRPGGRGVVVAVLDTGVAYRNWHQFRISPDFVGTRFVSPYDFVAGNRYPLDREGHGTFVTGTIAESTNNGIGLTGLAYGASIMPVRVLDASGAGDAATISRGIRYAVAHGAQVINLSLEFDMTVTAADIPDIESAILYAHRRGVVVVAAAGNDSSEQLAYPARTPSVISVGATTKDLCLADYSNGGSNLSVVAPGGGDDADLGQSNCNPDRNLPDIFQMTFPDSGAPGRFGYPGGWYGTSMASPHVAAVAALVIASGVLGPHPSPDQVLSRIEHTAQPLGGSAPNANYGYGLVDAGAATAPIAGVARRHPHKRVK